MQYEHECMDPTKDAPAARALLVNDCGGPGLFARIVAGICGRIFESTTTSMKSMKRFKSMAPPCDPTLWAEGESRCKVTELYDDSSTCHRRHP